VKREDVPLALADRINSDVETNIVLPWESISRWKGQFDAEVKE
jgi:hypothetical protein